MFVRRYLSGIGPHLEHHAIHILANNLCDLTQKYMLLALSRIFERFNMAV